MAGVAAKAQAAVPTDPAAADAVPPRRPSIGFYPFLGLAYFLAAVLAIHLNHEVGGIASFWTAGAILLTALIRCRIESWPWLLLSAGLADFAATQVMGVKLPASIAIAILDLLEPLVVVIALRASWDGRPWFLSIRWIAVFAFSSIVASLFVGTLGSLWLDFVGVGSFPTLWQTWVIADALGFFVVTPFLLSWTDPFFRGVTSRRTMTEVLGVTAGLAIASGIVFAGSLPFLFLLFPFLVLLALRGGLLGATAGLLVIAFVGTGFTLDGSGPIAALASSASTRILILQLYLFGAVVSTLSIALIMNQRRRLAEGLMKQTLISQAALDHMAQGLSMFDDQRRLVTCNERYSDLYQLPPHLRAPGTPLNDILEYHIGHGIYAGTPEEYLHKLEIDGRITATAEVQLSNGRIIEINRRPLNGGGWVSTHEDVTEQRTASDRISYLATHDSLTGMHNRSFFGDRLEEAIARSRCGQLFALHSIDLDRFKEVNDTLGHPAGDAILKQVAARLKSVIRSGDLVARVGGDEFSILQHRLQGPHEAVALAERIQESLGKPLDSAGHPVMIGASIGIAVSTGHDTDPAELMKKCDLALYRAKAEGRDSYRLFEEGMDALLQAQRQLEHELSCALPKGELYLVYQPILNLETNRIAAFEALARWNHPARGVVAPVEFISVAEDRGLIIPIGEWALREACNEAAKWPDDVRVAVNLSPVQFKAEGLVDAVAAALADSGLAAGRLELEVTESVLLLNTKSVLRTFKKLRALGVRLAMDDFGTGYSSLGYLRSFPFDKIKIDKSFVRGIGNDDCLAIVQATVALATKLGIATTAEGVETAEQLERMRLEACTEAQGYYITRPILAGAVPGVLEKQNGRWLQPTAVQSGNWPAARKGLAVARP